MSITSAMQEVEGPCSRPRSLAQRLCALRMAHVTSSACMEWALKSTELVGFGKLGAAMHISGKLHGGQPILEHSLATEAVLGVASSARN